MNKADRIHKQLIEKILTEGTWDEKPRPKYKDGQPAHTLFISQVKEEYDISLGEFPITQLRPIAYKMGINEMLAIYQSQTNSQEGFESHDCNWWINWMNEDGNLGRAYSYNLESHRPMEMNREVVKVERKIVDEKYGEPKEIPLVNEIEKSINGKVYMENTISPFIIINDRYSITENGQYKYEIQFLNTGNKKIIRGNDLNQSIKKNRLVKDSFSRSYYGIGYLGNHKSLANFKDEHLKLLIIKWESMFKRCYGKQGDKNKKNYQDKGVFVHQDWHSLEQFLKDVRYLPQYHLAKEDDFKGWDIDKDWFGSNAYSKDTCVFLKHRENIVYAHGKPLLVTDKKSGKKKIFLEPSKASEYIGASEYGLKTALYRKERLGRGIYNDYNFEFIESNDEFNYRYELSRNQINELIQKLKNDKFGRRNMLSFFHWANIDKKTLVECAFQSLYTVRKINNDYILDATLIMRSSDFATASSINCIQYVALQMMLAHECGMKVGKFVRFTQNLHLYDRHISQAYELLNREAPDSRPLLLLNAEGKSFYDITVDDFELINYEPVRPQLKFELGI